MKWLLDLLVATACLLALAAAQLTGRVGPTTSRESKRAKVCNVLDYGGVASKTADIGPAINKAFNACKTGGTGMSTSQRHTPSWDQAHRCSLHPAG